MINGGACVISGATKSRQTFGHACSLALSKFHPLAAVVVYTHRGMTFAPRSVQCAGPQGNRCNSGRL